jgi:dipeptide/tripeptide permease
MAGLIAPAITGVLVDQTGHFGAAFGLAAALQVVGFIGWVVVLPKVAPLRWAEATE